MPKHCMELLKGLGRQSLNKFYSSYPQIDSRKQPHIIASLAKKYKEREIATDLLSFLSEEEVGAICSGDSSIYRRAVSYMRAHASSGSEKVLGMLLQRNTNTNIKAFALFLYILARIKRDESLYYDSAVIKGEYRGAAKALGLHTVAKYASNLIFLELPEGRQFIEEHDYSKELRKSVRECKKIVAGICQRIDNDGSLSFYQLRLKAPLDVYEKIERHEFDVGPLELHDLIGVRVVLRDSVDRVAALEEMAERLLDMLIGNYGFCFNDSCKTAKDNIKDYHKNPKENGYNRMHILLKKDGVPLELQLDTESNYIDIETSARSIHGVQKSFTEQSDFIKKLTSTRKIKVYVKIHIQEAASIRKAESFLEIPATKEQLKLMLEEFLAGEGIYAGTIDKKVERVPLRGVNVIHINMEWRSSRGLKLKWEVKK
ncbi:MAG: hypothetical protein D6769_03150 [Methanobacteriota archaeon]|nr:MAG: hypothetical protein D6769_03150 [Euryarchaeota archaeon]